MSGGGGEKGGELGTKSRTERLLTKGENDDCDGGGDGVETASSNPMTDPNVGGAENGGVASRDGDEDRTNERG